MTPRSAPTRLRRALALVVGLVTSLSLSVPAAAAGEFSPDTIVFPVIGAVHYTDTFGDARSGGRGHDGTDILSDGAVKGLPVVAVADGVVRWIGSSCCYLSIDHGGGWESWYIHLDNDTPGTDDGLGWGIADGVVRGATVYQGQLIGWLGDSGNAEWVSPHLHFELRKDGVAVNSYPYLINAPVLDQVGASLWNGRFRDDDGSVHEIDIEKIAELGITKGCESDLYCPDRQITRGEMAAFLRRTFDLPSSDVDFYLDDTGDFFEDDINAVTAAGIGFGCAENEYCSELPLLREEMAELLVRAFGYTDPEGLDRFVDDDDSPFQSSINALAAAGVTYGCESDQFCPDRPLSRAEMASFFVRSLGL